MLLYERTPNVYHEEDKPCRTFRKTPLAGGGVDSKYVYTVGIVARSLASFIFSLDNEMTTVDLQFFIFS